MAYVVVVVIRIRYLISPTPAVKLEVLQGASALPGVSLYFFEGRSNFFLFLPFLSFFFVKESKADQRVFEV